MVKQVQQSNQRNHGSGNDTLGMEQGMSQELTQNKSEECSIEDILAQVEETIANLEADDISLEDSFAQYKKGMDLLKVCNEKIDAIEKKVLILNGEGETDEF